VPHPTTDNGLENRAARGGFGISFLFIFARLRQNPNCLSVRVARSHIEINAV
jgi:hypothetical protein